MHKFLNEKFLSININAYISRFSSLPQKIIFKHPRVKLIIINLRREKVFRAFLKTYNAYMHMFVLIFKHFWKRKRKQTRALVCWGGAEEDICTFVCARGEKKGGK